MSFLNPTVLGRQIKEAHKAEKLKVGILERDGDPGVAIFCKNTVYWIDVFSVPNKVKAAIIEYVGFMPSHSGDMYEDTQTGEYELMDHEVTKELQKQITGLHQAKIPYKETSLIAIERVSPIRLVQKTTDLEILGVREEYLDVIDLKFLDDENEGAPIGPNYTEEYCLMVYSNATTVFGCAAYMIGASRKFKEIIDTLTFVDMTED